MSHIDEILDGQAVIKNILDFIMKGLMYDIPKNFHSSNDKVWWKEITMRRLYVDIIIYSNAIRSTIIRFQVNGD